MKKYYIARYTYIDANGSNGQSINGSKYEGKFDEEDVYIYFLENAKEMGHNVHSFKLIDVHFFDTYEEMIEYNKLIEWD